MDGKRIIFRPRLHACLRFRRHCELVSTPSEDGLCVRGGTLRRVNACSVNHLSHAARRHSSIQSN